MGRFCNHAMGMCGPGNMLKVIEGFSLFDSEPLGNLAEVKGLLF